MVRPAGARAIRRAIVHLEGAGKMDEQAPGRAWEIPRRSSNSLWIDLDSLRLILRRPNFFGVNISLFFIQCTQTRFTVRMLTFISAAIIRALTLLVLARIMFFFFGMSQL